MASNERRYPFGYCRSLVGVPPTPGLATSASSRTRLRRGSMLRMTSRERVTRQRHEGIAAKRRKRPGAVTSQRFRLRLAERTDTLPAAMYPCAVPTGAREGTA